MRTLREKWLAGFKISRRGEEVKGNLRSERAECKEILKEGCGVDLGRADILGKLDTWLGAPRTTIVYGQQNLANLFE
jgi:hypothetical protein